ncbi:MAG: DUF3025 domain-containing protein [Betaproteobacteria bacterium]
MRPWLAAPRSLDALNALAAERELRTESGQPVQFVLPTDTAGYYEVSVYETGRVATRPENLHDWFNALAWLAFPQAKARINAMHAARIALEGGRRGRLRDLLTLFDEGGALVICTDATLVALLEGARWHELFWERRRDVQRAMRILVFGHAALESALAPWPGITCKALCLSSGGNPDGDTASWLRRLPADATPKALPSVPVFGYPRWMEDSRSPEFYEDRRYFRTPGG